MMTEDRTRQGYLDLACIYEALARGREARGSPVGENPVSDYPKNTDTAAWPNR
jgi:hypothetical protein